MRKLLSRTPPPERPRPIGMHPGPPLTEPSSSTVQVWCGTTLMQNMVVAAPLLTGTLHFDMEAMTDTSLVRVTSPYLLAQAATLVQVLTSEFCPVDWTLLSLSTRK